MEILFNADNAAMAYPYKDIVIKTAARAAAVHGFINAIIDITVTDNKTIREINKKYLTDSVTDCLSFPQYERDEIALLDKTDISLLGDVIISFDKAQEQAAEYGHSIEREIAFLTLHGVLHLLGYDHKDTSDEQEMFKKQDEILTELDILR